MHRICEKALTSRPSYGGIKIGGFGYHFGPVDLIRSVNECEILNSDMPSQCRI